jgi:hypothetical protein
MPQAQPDEQADEENEQKVRTRNHHEFDTV